MRSQLIISAFRFNALSTAADVSLPPPASVSLFIAGLAQFLSGPASRAEKEALIAEVKPAFAAHPDSIESWVAVITGLDSDDAPQLIRELIADKQMFNVAQAGHARTAVRSWANIRKRSLLTGEYTHIQFTLTTVPLTCSPVNWCE